jgi:hypothetical protein
MDIHSGLELFGIIVAVASAVSSALNEVVRNKKKPNSGLVAAQVVLNAVALNADKVKQAVGLLKGKK